MNTEANGSFDSLASALEGRLHERSYQAFGVSDGLGVDSKAMLVALEQLYRGGLREARPDVILFANTGAEKPETLAIRSVWDQWLADVGFPIVTEVQYCPVTAPYDTLEGNCLANATLPSLAFGGRKGCSQKFKVQVMNAWMQRSEPARRTWADGRRMIKAIGYDAGPKDARRCDIPADRQYRYLYPLRLLGWDRTRCIDEISAVGLPGWNPDNETTGELYWVGSGGVPVKSACFFCPAQKAWEVARQERRHPELNDRVIRMEEIAAPNLLQIKGLWGKGSQGKRAPYKPGCMTELIALLRSGEPVPDWAQPDAAARWQEARMGIQS